MKQLIQINTLDEKHKKTMASFQNRKNLLPQKKKKVQYLKYQLQKLESINPSTFTMDDIKKRAELKTSISELENEIYDIENDVSELEYYFKTGDIIMDYYEMVDNDDNYLYNEIPELCEEQLSKNTKKISPCILDELNKINIHKRKPKRVTKRRRKTINDNSQNNILDFLGGKINNKCLDDSRRIQKNKSELLDQYLMLVDSEYMCTKKKINGKFIRCLNCDIEKTLFHSEGIFVCLNCGEVEMIIIDSEKPNYKEAITDAKPGYPYKRINHLNEWLAQFQAKESIEIPDYVYDNIRNELNKIRFYNMKQLNLVLMKKILKKLSLQQYYEHATYIISKLSGIPPPMINRETEEKIRLMFRQIQAPFEKYCPKERTNFLSYSYVLHKFFQLLGLDEFVKYFPLLKSREKLKQQDVIWEKICSDLKWDYISSV
jgi:hypothetical protein